MGQAESKSYQMKFDSEIYKNTYVETWNELINSIGLRSDYEEYKKTGKKQMQYIAEKLDAGEISIEKINGFLERDISFGRHKNVQIYELNNIKKSIGAIKGALGIKNDILEFNKLLEVSNEVNLGEIKLGYLKVLEKIETEIMYLRMIYISRVEIIDSFGIKQFENSYFTVDLNFKESMLLVKYYEKGKVKGDFKSEEIVKKVIGLIKNLNLFNIIGTNQTKNQRALYNICDLLLNEIINENSNRVINNIDEITTEISGILKAKLKASIDVDEMLEMSKKNIFDVDFQLKSFLENIAISKVVHDGKTGIVPKHMKGIISYIKYRDKNSNTTVKKDTKMESLLDSNTYLNLRSVIKQGKLIEEIKLLFNRDTAGFISLRYDASKACYLEVKFYSKYGKEDIEYALRELNSFGEK